MVDDNKVTVKELPDASGAVFSTCLDLTSLSTSVSNSKVRNEPNFGSMSQRPRPRSKWCSRNAASDEVAQAFRLTAPVDSGLGWL